METKIVHQNTPGDIWNRANVRLIPSLVLSIAGAYISVLNGNVRRGDANHKIIAVFGIILFIIFASAFLQVLTQTIFRVISRSHLSPGRAATFRFFMRLVGYVAIFFILLDLLSIPVGKLLLGGAAIGVILGVAAQQALANFFASIVLIISSPFSVGETISINSGALGGRYIGRVIDIGLTHTKLMVDDSSVVSLPNATLLSAATITKQIVKST